MCSGDQGDSVILTLDHPYEKELKLDVFIPHEGLKLDLSHEFTAVAWVFSMVQRDANAGPPQHCFPLEDVSPNLHLSLVEEAGRSADGKVNYIPAEGNVSLHVGGIPVS